MATRKAGKKSGKGAAGKKSVKKSAAKKGSAKKAGAKKAGAGKATPAKKGGAKKAGAKKGVTKAAVSPAATKAPSKGAAPQPCLDLLMAGDIIRACAPANFDINKPLCEFLTPANLPFLQQCILNQVLARGCNIQLSQIPADCDSTLGDIMDAIVINAVKA